MVAISLVIAKPGKWLPWYPRLVLWGGSLGAQMAAFFLFSKCVSLVIGKAWALLSGC